ncbi:MAG TPA: RidA family protein [Steroidobacteraceae bacterium]|nr:RidA family protein [Steroidobacteraceae bacterium]
MHHRHRTWLFAVLFAAAGPVCALEPDLDRINPDGLTAPKGYAQVVTSSPGRMVFVSGQAGVEVDGTIPEDLGEQARLMLEKLDIALDAAGASRGHVTRITVYIVDLHEIDPTPIYEAITNYFPEAAKPASTVVGVSALALPGLKVEIEATAVTDPAIRKPRRKYPTRTTP